MTSLVLAGLVEPMYDPEQPMVATLDAVLIENGNWETHAIPSESAFEAIRAAIGLRMVQTRCGSCAVLRRE